MLKMINRNMKRLDIWDMACTKTAVAFFVMFLFSVWTGFREFVLSTSSFILFLGWIIFAIRPILKFFSKRSE